MTEQIQTDWEKEFEKFEYIGIALDWYMMNAYPENRKPGREHLEDVKQFIKGVVDQAQQQERQRVIEEVERDNNLSVIESIRRITNSLYRVQKQLEVQQKMIDNYNELIIAVGNKHGGETRHQTALRYIKQAEQGSENESSTHKEETK